MKCSIWSVDGWLSVMDRPSVLRQPGHTAIWDGGCVIRVYKVRLFAVYSKLVLSHVIMPRWMDSTDLSLGWPPWKWRDSTPAPTSMMALHPCNSKAHIHGLVTWISSSILGTYPSHFTTHLCPQYQQQCQQQPGWDHVWLMNYELLHLNPSPGRRTRRARETHLLLPFKGAIC